MLWDFLENKATTTKKNLMSARFGSTCTKIGTIQRRLARPLCKDDRKICKASHIFHKYVWCQAGTRLTEGDHFVSYISIWSLHCTPETNIILYVNYNYWIIKKYFQHQKKKRIWWKQWTHVLKKQTYTLNSASKFQKVYKMSKPIYQPCRTEMSNVRN